MKLTVISGAGLSAQAPSNIPTFRTGNDGLWQGFDLNKVCNILTWKQNRTEVFDFYSKRFSQYGNAQPNEAHYLLARLKARYPDTVQLFTQNVDNLLEKAGVEPEAVVHLHGNIEELLCTACGTTFKGALDVSTKCVKCGSVKGVKPGVVFFGEKAPEYSRLYKAVKEFSAEDILLFIGTSFQVISPEKFLSAVRKQSPFKKPGLVVNINIQSLKDTDPDLYETHFDKEFVGTASDGLEQFLRWYQETNEK